MIKPQLPSGMRDFLPGDMIRRAYVIDTISEVFQTFGYEPLQTPVLELNETLMGKYGADAEKLIYYAQHPGGKEQLAMRYDLTVPLARAFAMHEADLSLPFKRYQIAPVWRAERPQRGRFREFYQCDADVVGISGMDADAESVSVIDTVMRRLGFRKFAIKINNRKLLTGIGQYAGLTGEALSNLYRSIDKLDKIGPDGVRSEMIKGGLEPAVIDKIMALIVEARPQNPYGYEVAASTLAATRETLDGIPAAQEGLEELDHMLRYLKAMDVPGEHIDLDFAMVRGLSYYTGPIFEAMLLSDDPEERVGSLSGGGRYDDLIGLFRRESLPTVGMSLGIERLITILEQRNAYPPNLSRTVVDVLVSVFTPDTRTASMSLAAALRDAGIRTELYMQDRPIGKQLGYADKKGIKIVALLGPDEIARGEVKFKRLANQHEVIVRREEAIAAARNLLNA
ncbi:MAG TPA: histidine--tRNA ligase [Aggregatilineales bacterium]|nr:histidine--tRNA ligase [Aggregatilineales bacterium]